MSMVILQCVADYTLLLIGIGMVIGCLINAIAKCVRRPNPYSAME